MVARKKNDLTIENEGEREYSTETTDPANPTNPTIFKYMCNR